MTVCRICSADADHQLFTVLEMQFGTREAFVYFECSSCKCLQLRDVPKNPLNYYPESYYSFNTIKGLPSRTFFTSIKRLGRRAVVNYRLGSRVFPGRLLEKQFGSEFIPYWLVKAGVKISPDSKILDVGSGSGDNLIKLESIGFTNLLGIDPFISSDTTYANGVKVLKLSLESLNDSFDFIMLHHSLEHMEHQLRVLKKVNSLLRQDCYALIRIPIKSYAWERYQTNWAQIDAPRHVCLHTPLSIRLLASQAGFEVLDMVFDSDEFQFWASEQYAKDIPLIAGDSYAVNPAQSMFSEEDIKSFRKRAGELNRNCQGDQACVYLQKTL